MNPEYLRHNNAGENPIYQKIPDMLAQLLDEIPEVQGFAIGGSYASGTWTESDDVDIDVLFNNMPDSDRYYTIKDDIRVFFMKRGIIIQIRAPLAKTLITETMRRDIYARHPGTPFVVRNENVANDWGLHSD